MANKYGMVKCYFEHGMWSANQVKDAVTKGLITSDEYKKITGEEFNIAYLKERENKSIRSIRLQMRCSAEILPLYACLTVRYPMN